MRTRYAYHFKEPLGVVGQIIPWNFPILMAVMEDGACTGALATASMLKPAESDSGISILVLMPS
jgi:aldehyde dehydrogenase